MKFENFLRDRIPQRIEIRHVIWICAFTPLLIGPPLFSLSYCFWSVTRRKNNGQQSIEWIAIISVINLIVSVIILQKLSAAFVDTANQFPFAIMMWLRNLFGAPGIGPDPELSA